MSEPFFRRNTGCIARKNGAAQRKKNRCLGVLTVFRYALEKLCDMCLCMKGGRSIWQSEDRLVTAW